ncbi:MAG: hypothetical protein SFY68_01440 [Candidatus Sumerlaeia bacterium]|nr:hypothetical protein [Candidatus Sumerlaeia bacterium]
MPNPEVFATHDIGSTIEDAVSNGAFHSLPVPQGETFLVAATSQDSNAPQLLAFGTDSHSQVSLSALSTCSAMIFFSPGIYTNDSTLADTRLAAIAQLSGVLTAASIANSYLASGRDFLQDAAFEAALVEALTEYSQQLADDLDAQMQAPEQKTSATTKADVPALGFATGTPRDLPGSINVLNVNLIDPSIREDGVPINRFEFVGRPFIADKTINPLDWIAFAWAIDPEEFDGGLQEIRSLTAAQVESKVYNRLGNTPVSMLSVKSSNPTKLINLVEVAQDYLLTFFPTFPPPDGLEFPGDRPGVYMVRTYSGAVFPQQESLLSALPEAGDADALMKGINMVLGSLDAAGIVVPIKTLLGREATARIVYSAAREATSALFREGNEAGGISLEFMQTLFFETTKAIIKQILFIAAEEGLKALPRVGKTLFKAINILEKGANIGATIERFAALTNASRLISERAFFAPAVETTVVVIGDPYAPEVLRIEPRKAHRGRTIRITGRRFLDGEEDRHIVRFGASGTDPFSTVSAGEVILATEDTLLVEIPEDAESGYISVAIQNRGVTTSVSIPEAQGFFTVIPDPVITQTQPASVAPGGLVQLRGMNFSAIREENRVTFTGASGAENLQIVSLSHDDSTEEDIILVQAPSGLGTGNVLVKVGNRTSNGFPLTTILTAPISSGDVLRVTTLLDNTAADQVLTLREAILHASGRLGRNLTAPPQERPEGITYETDFAPSASGAGTRETILFDLPQESSRIITLTGPLPSLGNYDIIQLGSGTFAVTLQSPGGEGDSVVIDGIYSVLEGGVFTGFTGPAFLFTGEAQANSIRNCVVENPVTLGVRFEGNATGNLIDVIDIESPGSDGIQFDGPGVLFNRMSRPTVTGSSVNIGSINNAGGWGIRILNGASFNWIATGNITNSTSGGISVDSASKDNVLGRSDSSIGIFPKIFDNNGPGVLVEGSGTKVFYMNIGNNNGDGVLFQGGNAVDGVCDVLRIGYHYNTGVAAPNLGNGIHIRNGARDILIGRRSQSSFGARMSIAGNRDDGIRVDGNTGTANFVDVKHTHIGLAISNITTEVPLANGRGGIALINARDCELGDVHRDLDLHVNMHTNGPGILIDGLQATRNRVINCQIGSHHDGRNGIGNAIGIQVSGGAWGNFIGQPNLPFNGDKGGNAILNNSVAGIVVESGGNPTITLSPGDQPTGGNVIRSNFIGGPADDNPFQTRPNGVGLLLRNNAKFNLVGGPNPADSNLFLENSQAGIHLDGFTANKQTQNRIEGNLFIRQGIKEPLSLNPLQQRPKGVGVLLTNADGHTIGNVNDPLAGNTFAGNQVGAYVESCENVTITGNHFGPRELFPGNTLAGVILQNSEKCVCGPNNTILRNGNGTESLGGIVVSGGSENIIVANQIGGTPANNLATQGNSPHGITLVDSSSNKIGGTPGNENTILNSTGAGILVRGAASTENIIQGNRIGVRGNLGRIPYPNLGGGILVDEGASNTLIGGEAKLINGGFAFVVPVGNRILANQGNGVTINGAGSIGNTIRWNSITDHSFAAGQVGIRLLGGSNNGILPPAITSFDGITIKGTVDPLIPNGSIVQVFSDADDEGEVPLGETTVLNGEWSFVPGLLPYSALTATVTHAINGSTSEFGGRVTIDDLANPAFFVRRTIPGIPQLSVIEMNSPSILQDLEVESGDFQVVVRSLIVSLADSSSSPSLATPLTLYHDTDDNGFITDADTLLAASSDFDSDAQGWIFDDLNSEIEPLTTQRWLLTGGVTSVMPMENLLQFEIETALDVDSVLHFPASIITAQGPFPVQADQLQLVEQRARSLWMMY